MAQIILGTLIIAIGALVVGWYGLSLYAAGLARATGGVFDMPSVLWLFGGVAVLIVGIVVAVKRRNASHPHA